MDSVPIRGTRYLRPLTDVPIIHLPGLTGTHTINGYGKKFFKYIDNPFRITSYSSVPADLATFSLVEDAAYPAMLGDAPDLFGEVTEHQLLFIVEHYRYCLSSPGYYTSFKLKDDRYAIMANVLIRADASLALVLKNIDEKWVRKAYSFRLVANVPRS